MVRSGYKRPDALTQQAKQAGFPARSVYKLEEIDRRLKLLRPGQEVLDLGAFPGSWSRYAAQRVGASGKVLGIDQQPHVAPLLPNCEMRCADVRQLQAADFGEQRFDVVLSDMAPATTGQRQLDQVRSYDLFVAALDLAAVLVQPGGHFVGKIFQGAEFSEAQQAVRAMFEETRVVRPKATRSVSYEVFLVGLRRRRQQSGW